MPEKLHRVNLLSNYSTRYNAIAEYNALHMPIFSRTSSISDFFQEKQIRRIKVRLYKHDRLTSIETISNVNHNIKDPDK